MNSFWLRLLLCVKNQHAIETPVGVRQFKMPHHLLNTFSTDMLHTGFSASEWNAADDAYRNRFAVDAAGFPVRHHVEYAHRFFVKRFLNTFKHRNMAYSPIGINHKRAGDASLNTLFVSFIRIFTCPVDKFHQLAVTPRK